MKKLRIFCLPSHATKERTSGVDFARIIQPMQHLNGWKNDEYEIETHIYDPVKDEKLDWLKVVVQHDILFFNYTANPWAFAAMGAIARKFGRPMVMDFDDNLWNVQEDNPAYSVYKKGEVGIKNFTAIVNEVDFVTVTNQYLKNLCSHNSRKTLDKIKVFDNYIDLKLYKYPQEFKDDGQITLTHFGSSTHYTDLQNKAFVDGVDRIMKNYPNVNFLTVGSFIPLFRSKWGQRYQNEFGDIDLYKWVQKRFPEVMAKTDICVVPLEENIYTKCKSAIKFLEMSSAKKPGVWQRIRQYINVVDGKNGLLASTSDEWYEAIKKLVENNDARKEIGEIAYKTIVKNHQMKKNIDTYANFFIEVDKKQSKD